MAPKNESDGRVETKLDMFIEHVTKHGDRVDEVLTKLDGRLDSIDVTLGQQNTVLGHQHLSLVEHVKRSDLIERRLELEVEKLNKKVEEETKAITKKLEPVNDHVTKMKIFIKIVVGVLGAGGAGAGAGFGLKKLFEAIMG